MAGLVEGTDAESAFSGDFCDVFDAEDALRFEFGGQAVGVPAEAAFNTVAEHGLVAADGVLHIAGEEVSVVREAVGEGRAVVEDEFVVSAFARWTIVNGLLEGVVGGPKGQCFAFHLREGRVRVHFGVAVARIVAVLRHGVLVCSLHRDEDRRRRHPRYHPACLSFDCRGRGRLILSCDGLTRSVLMGRASAPVLPKTPR